MYLKYIDISHIYKYINNMYTYIRTYRSIYRCTYIHLPCPSSRFSYHFLGKEEQGGESQARQFRGGQRDGHHVGLLNERAHG